MSLDHDGPGDDDDGEAVRADRTALRERILEAAYDPARLQACPEVEALAVRVAAVWSPSGLDLAGSDSDPEQPPQPPQPPRAGPDGGGAGRARRGPEQPSARVR